MVDAIFYGSLIGFGLWFLNALGKSLKAWEEFNDEC